MKGGIDKYFSGKSSCGVRIYEALNKFENMDVPRHIKEKGNFYDSRNFIGVKNADLPVDADANGAYNIARKGLWAISQIKNAETDQELKKARISITNKEWLEFAQK